jgi:hypothetical protein
MTIFFPTFIVTSSIHEILPTSYTPLSPLQLLNIRHKCFVAIHIVDSIQASEAHNLTQLAPILNKVNYIFHTSMNSWSNKIHK